MVPATKLIMPELDVYTCIAARALKERETIDSRMTAHGLTRT